MHKGETAVMTNYSFYIGFNEMLAARGAAETAEYARKMGFSSVEILESAAPGHPMAIPDTKAAKEVRRVLDSYHLQTACYSVGCDVYHNDEAVQSLKKQAEIAAALGCPYLHHTLSPSLVMPNPAPDPKEVLDACAEAAVSVARYAKTLGVRCIYEDQGMYVNGCENFGYFYDEVRRAADNAGICGDVGNILFVDASPVSFFSAYAKDICHVHIKDYLYKETPVSPGRYWMPTRGGAWLRDTTVGSGVIDFGGCIDILKQADYRGAYALELCHPEPFDDGVRQAMAYLERYL